MAVRREITKKFAREYVRAGKTEKGAKLDALVARRGGLVTTPGERSGTPGSGGGVVREQQHRLRPRKYSSDALVVLQEVWRLAGQPFGDVSCRGRGRHPGTAGPVRGVG